MKTVFILFFLTLSCFMFGRTNKIDLNIPDTVNMQKTASHEHLNMNVYMIRPKGYGPRIKEHDFSFRADDFETLIETNTNVVTFNDEGKAMVKKVIRDDPYVLYTKEFRFGQYDAIIYCSSESHNSKIGQLTLMLGDKDFSLVVKTGCKMNDVKAREKIVRAFLSCYVDKVVYLGCGMSRCKFESYSLNIAESMFKSHSKIGDTRYFSYDGIGDITSSSMPIITIKTLPAIPEKELKTSALSILEKDSTGDKKVLEEKAIVINGLPAYEIFFNKSSDGKSISVFQMLTGNDKLAVLYTGTVNRSSDYGKGMEEMFVANIKALAQTLEVNVP